jgi:SAM-dependent methyltransferase
MARWRDLLARRRPEGEGAPEPEGPREVAVRWVPEDGGPERVGERPAAPPPAPTSVWQPGQIGPEPEHPEWLRRYAVARDQFVPWIEDHVPLAGRTVLEYGCGQGAVSCAVAQRCGRLIGVDIGPRWIRMAREHVARRGLDNVELDLVGPEEIVAHTRRYAGQVDVVLLYAVLEHLTIAERVDVLSLAREIVRPDGHIVVVETPNRLTPMDHHTAQTPFFHQLPGELAARWYRRAPRADFVDLMDLAALEGPDALREELVRFGYGMSFHEFELVFDDLAAHTVASSYARRLYRERPVRGEELQLQQTLDCWRPDLPPCFSRSWLDMILSARPLAEAPVHVRPWAMALPAGTPGVAVHGDGRFELAADARLPVRLPHATDVLHVGFVASDPEEALRVHLPGWTAHVRAAAPIPEHPAWHAELRLDTPAQELELSLAAGGVLTYVGFAGPADPAAATSRAWGW